MPYPRVLHYENIAEDCVQKTAISPGGAHTAFSYYYVLLFSHATDSYGGASYESVIRNLFVEGVFSCQVCIILVPPSHFRGLVMQTCQEYKEWVEEKWEEPIERRKKGYKEECKKKKCKKLCLCCNKWVCWIVTFWYWVVEWVIRIIAKWVVYVICRIVAALITLFWAIVFWFRALLCSLQASKQRQNIEDLKRLGDLTFRANIRLQLQVVIIDKDEKTKNSITKEEIDVRIAAADRILRERAHIAVKRKGKVRRSTSKALYDIEGEGAWEGIGEWFKHIAFVLGRESPRRLVIFAVNRIGTDTSGRHYPIYGSLFIVPGTPHTMLCHEIGHALLNLDNMGHVADIKNLMYATDNEAAVGWPTQTPILEVNQWCAMRQSRWLDWTWGCEECP